AGRSELAAKEEQEMTILQEFLPTQLTADEVVALVRQAIADSGAQGARDMGKVMKLIMPQVTGRADGKLVNDTVKELLAQS
ncbi:MAG TPA: GatB/YqeY domain-containing protein, partial [Geobacteraceae bacterium]